VGGGGGGLGLVKNIALFRLGSFLWSAPRLSAELKKNEKYTCNGIDSFGRLDSAGGSYFVHPWIHSKEDLGDWLAETRSIPDQNSRIWNPLTLLLGLTIKC